MKQVIGKVVKLFGPNIFLKTDQFLAAIEDLNPTNTLDIQFLKKIYTKPFAQLLYEGYTQNKNINESVIGSFIETLCKNEKIHYTDTYTLLYKEIYGITHSTVPNYSSIQNSDAVVKDEKEVFVFDSQRYLKEIKDDIYQQADKAFAKGDFNTARILFNRAYVFGNIHAGVRLGQMYWNGQDSDIDYEEAIKIFVVGKTHGNPLANEWLAEAYRFGDGVPQNVERAKELSNNGKNAMLDMCTLSDPDAMYVVGWNYINSPFYTNNPQVGFSWYERAAQKGHVNATVQMALCLIDGIGCIQDVKRGLQILEMLTKSTDNSTAHFQLGKLYYSGKKVEENIEKARKHFMVAAKKNNKMAQCYLGDIYYWGRGGKKDYVEAHKWYIEAFSKGVVNAAKQLGFMYFNGEGVNQCLDEAYKYFKYAADKGHARAQYMLHYFYLESEKYKNYQAGCAYLTKSAEAGDVLAQTLLGLIYLDGQYGLSESEERFIYWIQKAADQGHADAEYILGEAYAQLGMSDVLPEDFEKAVYWVQKAADQDYKIAFVKLAEYYYEGKGVPKDTSKASLYAKKFEDYLIDSESRGIKLAKSWGDLAKYYDKAGEDRKALDCYWKSLRDGDLEALYDVGWDTLIKNVNSAYRTMSDSELIDSIKEHALDWENSNLAYLLGMYYIKNKLLKDAEIWFLRASGKGSITALCRLSSLYHNELHQYHDAFKYAQEAFNAGSAEGAYQLGMLYKWGRGTPKDNKKAKELLKIAANRGNEEAVKKLNKLFF